MNTHSGRSIKKLYQSSVKALRRSKHSDVLLMTQEIIDRQADHAGAHAVQFSSLFKSKKFELARLMGNQAAELNPKSVFILNNQACLELEKKNPKPAADLLNSLIDQYGERAQWLYNLALAYELIGHLERAIGLFRRTLDLDPTHEKAARQLSDTLEKIGHFEEAAQAYDYNRLIQNTSSSNHCAYIHCAVSSGNISAESLRQELSLWEDRFIPKGSRYEVAKIDSKKPVTIGFIGTKIDYSWMERIVIPVANKLAENDDRVLFYTHEQKVQLNDNVTVINAQNLSDPDFARRVRDDKVDILIDVCGMRKGNRQRALGLQLATKQFAWLGHEGDFATPLLGMLDDKVNHVFSPENTSERNAEDSKNLWPTNTFAGLSGQNGLSYDVIKTWASILQRCPDWSLNIGGNAKANLVLAKSVDDNGTEKATVAMKSNEQVEKLLEQRFSAAGVSRDRVTFNTQLKHDETTIVLDNFSNNNPVELSESLLAGATPVTLNGPLFPAHKNARLMQQVGLKDHVCENQANFIERAVSLANGIEKMTPLDNRKQVAAELSDLDTFVKAMRSVLVS